MTAPPVITAKVYDVADIATSGLAAIPTRVLTGARKRGWYDAYSHAGTGQVTIPNSHPDAAHLAPDQYVSFELNGTPCFGFVVGDETVDSLKANGGVDQETLFAGVGLLGLLSEAIVYPPRGADTRPLQDDRLFSWQAPEYDDTAWTAATVLCTLAYAQANWPVLPFAESMPTTTPPPVVAPAGSTVPGIGEPTGDWYFRKTVNFPFGGSHAFYFSPDNTGSLYVDGCSIMDVTTEQGYLKATFVNIDMTAGDHTIAGVVHNLPALGTHNPTAAVLAIYAGEADQSSSTYVTSLDATWKTLEFPVPAPGMTPGKVIAVCLAEAHARGALTGWTTDCTALVDSAGHAWNFLGDIATRVGTDYRTFFLDEMAATYIDVECDPLSMVIHAYNFGTLGATTAVTLHTPTDPNSPATGNLTELVHQMRSTTTNTLLNRWNDGWHERAATPVTGVRRKEAPLQLGTVRSTSEVERIADQQLATFANVRQAITVGWEPESPADLPYGACRPGDTITVPDVTGVATAERIVSFTVTEDDNGKVLFVAEIADVILQAQQRLEQVTKKMSDGTLRGSTSVTTPPTVAQLSFRPPAPAAAGGAGDCNYGVWFPSAPFNSIGGGIKLVPLDAAELTSGTILTDLTLSGGIFTFNTAGDYAITGGVVSDGSAAPATLISVDAILERNGSYFIAVPSNHNAYDVHVGERIYAFAVGDTLKLFMSYGAGSSYGVGYGNSIAALGGTYLQIERRCAGGVPQVGCA